jgi:hypothetical protein
MIPKGSWYFFVRLYEGKWSSVWQHWNPAHCQLVMWRRAAYVPCIQRTTWLERRCPRGIDSNNTSESTVAHSLYYSDVFCSRLAKIRQSISDLWTRAAASESNTREPKKSSSCSLIVYFWHAYHSYGNLSVHEYSYFAFYEHFFGHRIKHTPFEDCVMDLCHFARR